MRVELEFPADLVEEIAAHAAEIVLAELSEPLASSPYLVGWGAAATYLAMPVSTLKHSSDVPRRKVGGSVLFRKDELDEWVNAGFEGARRFHHGSIAARSRTGKGIADAHTPAK